MEGYELYVLILCLIVYTALVALFSVLITLIVRQSLKLIRVGAEDEKIKTEYLKERQKKKAKIWGIIDKIIPIITCAFLSVFFVFSLTVNVKGCDATGETPVFRVVSSSSMASKYEGNKYLFDNDLNNQLQTFDVILTHKLPKEEDLKLYDIVVYEVDGVLLVHRIVGIEEPNEKHAERFFLLQGDAVSSPDRFPVRYSQMRGIYKGVKIPFVGSFVFFMQSPAGFLCMGLIIFATAIMPFVEKKLKKAKDLRLVAMGIINENGEYVEGAETAVVATSDSATSGEGTTSGLGENAEQTRSKSKGTPFAVKLKNANELLKDRYKQIVTSLLVCSKIKEKTSFAHQSFYCGRTPLARILIKGDVLCVYLAIEQSHFDEETDFITHATNARKHDDFPVHINVTSLYKTERVVELVNVLMEQLKEAKKLTDKDLLEPAFYDFELVFGQRKEKSLTQRILESPAETRDRYRDIVDYATANMGVIVKESRKYHTIKKDGQNIARISLRGKALRVYLALDPKDFINTEHKFSDASTVKEHEKFPMLVKITSQRKLDSVKELIDELV